MGSVAGDQRPDGHPERVHVRLGGVVAVEEHLGGDVAPGAALHESGVSEGLGKLGQAVGRCKLGSLRSEGGFHAL